MIRLSIIIPAHNEEPVVANAIKAARAAASTTGVSFEIVVVDDASTDRTAAIAEAEAARVVRVNVRQIARARNAGAAVAEGDTLLFVDADTFVTSAAVHGAVAAMEGAAGGGAAAQFDEPVPADARALLRLLVSAMRFHRIAFGCFLFCTKQAFHAVGGFDERLFAAEEIAMSRALQKVGRVVILREAVVTSGRKMRTHTRWELLKTFARVAAGGLRGVRCRLPLWYASRRADPKAPRSV